MKPTTYRIFYYDNDAQKIVVAYEVHQFAVDRRMRRLETIYNAPMYREIEE